jgi:hypothetical protein
MTIFDDTHFSAASRSKLPSGCRDGFKSVKMAEVSHGRRDALSFTEQILFVIGVVIGVFNPFGDTVREEKPLH